MHCAHTMDARVYLRPHYLPALWDAFMCTFVHIRCVLLLACSFVFLCLPSGTRHNRCICFYCYICFHNYELKRDVFVCHYDRF